MSSAYTARSWTSRMFYCYLCWFTSCSLCVYIYIWGELLILRCTYREGEYRKMTGEDEIELFMLRERMNIYIISREKYGMVEWTWFWFYLMLNISNTFQHKIINVLNYTGPPYSSPNWDECELHLCTWNYDLQW